MSQLHLVRVMRERIARLGNKAALRVQQDGQWRAIGWRTLGQAMDYCAQALIRAGHQPTEMVGLYARNMPEWTQADLGILAARGVSVPIYPTSTLEQLRYIVKDAGIKLLFVGGQAQFDQALLLLKSGEINQIVTLDGTVDLRGCEQASHFQTFLVSGNHQPSEQALREREQHYRMDDLLTLIYTSGTTGEPKGVMLDFNNIAACFEMHDRRLDLGEQDVSLCMLPLSHVFERAWSYYVLYCGAENVYIRDPQKVMEVIGEVKPTVMCAVPCLAGPPGSASGWSPPARPAGPPPPCFTCSWPWPSGWCFASCVRASAAEPASCRWQVLASRTTSTSSSRPWGSTSNTATA